MRHGVEGEFEFVAVDEIVVVVVPFAENVDESDLFGRCEMVG